MTWISEHRRKWREVTRARINLRAALEDDDLPRGAEELRIAQEAILMLQRFSADTFAQIDSRVQELYERIGLGHRPLPAVVELVEIDINSDIHGTGDKFLLLESPEPLDWKRMTVTCRRAGTNVAGTNVKVRVLWSNDQTRAFIFRDDGSWFTRGEYRFVFRYRGDY
jgi:hypothetical protein